MTMQNLPHPDDEQLAAYAGGDPDVTGDATLVAHLATCDRCGPLVDELSLLRGALAELPDLIPSRPLRLIPPVPAPAPVSAGGWLRRLTAPAMAAGAGLVLVGAIGIGTTSGFFSQASSAMFENVGDNLQGAGAPESEATASDSAYMPGVKGSPAATSNETRGSTDSAGVSQPPTAQMSPDASPTGSDVTEVNRESSDEQPWLTLLIAGAAVFVTATALRFTISPRAG
jgi:hypothetical protein